MKRNGTKTLEDRAIEQLDKYEAMYDYTKESEHEDALQKIIDEYK